MFFFLWVIEEQSIHYFVIDSKKRVRWLKLPVRRYFSNRFRLPPKWLISAVVFPKEIQDCGQPFRRGCDRKLCKGIPVAKEQRWWCTAFGGWWRVWKIGSALRAKLHNLRWVKYISKHLKKGRWKRLRRRCFITLMTVTSFPEGEIQWPATSSAISLNSLLSSFFMVPFIKFETRNKCLPLLAVSAEILIGLSVLRSGRQNCPTLSQVGSFS